MSAFTDLGLSAPVAAAALESGYDGPTPLQSAAIPVLRRGGNVALVASAGSGVTAAWGMALLDRLTDSTSASPEGDAMAGTDQAMRPRALVLTATEDRAARVARALVRLSSDGTVPVRALTVEWSTRGGEGVLVAPIAAAARALRESTLKLDALETIVFEQVGLLLGLEGAAVFDALGAALPADAQRVVVTADWSRPIQRFVEAHARRALTIPAKLAHTGLAVPPEPAGSLSYIAVPANEKMDSLARVLRRRRPVTPVVAVRSRRRAGQVIEELRVRGFIAGGEPADDLDVVVTAAAGAVLIAGDVPFDADGLSVIDRENGLVIVEPSELAHLRSIADESGIELKPVGGRQSRSPAAAYRERVEKAIEEEDIEAQIALLEPLFESHSAVEVAAALSALLRERQAEAPPEARAEASPGRPAAFVRLFVSAGTRDNIRTGDLVGAITGESGVKGEQVGKIELRDSFSVVEIAADVADRVIKALNGTTLRGRSLRVDFDRKTASPPSRPGRPSPRSPRGPDSSRRVRSHDKSGHGQ